MTIVKTLVASAGIAAAIAGYAGLPARAGDAPAQRVVAPLKAALFDVGHKRALAYFESGTAACEVSVLVADRFDEASAPQGVNAVRFNSRIGGGESVTLDTAEGPALALKCEPGAGKLSIAVLERLAYADRVKK